MKNLDIQSQGFRELSTEEQQIYSGGGFAYDVGRLIRFLVIGAGGMGGPANAIGDAAYVSTL